MARLQTISCPGHFMSDCFLTCSGSWSFVFFLIQDHGVLFSFSFRIMEFCFLTRSGSWSNVLGETSDCVVAFHSFMIMERIFGAEFKSISRHHYLLSDLFNALVRISDSFTPSQSSCVIVFSEYFMSSQSHV